MNTTPARRLMVAIPAWLLMGLVACECETQAQSILAPRPEFSITPPAVLQYQANNQMEVFAPPEAVTRPDQPLLRWGPVGFRPHALYRFFGATGLPAGETNHVDSIVQEFSPGLLLNLGDHWSLDYTPTWRFYSNEEFRNTLDHYVRLIGGTTYEDWVFGLSQVYQLASEPLVETGTQTERQAFLTALNASYQFNSKMSTDLAINQNIISADEFQSSSDWATLDWLNYQFWPRLDAGFGVGFGYTDVEAGSDMSYEQLQCRINWRATDKLSLRVSGGGEFRQFLDGDADDVLNPVAAGVIQYQPFDVTRLSLNLSRVVSVSLLTADGGQSQLTETVGLTGHLNQRLFQKLYLDLSGGYQAVTYVSTGNADTDREDDIYTFSARLTCPFLKQGMVAVFYQYSDISSTTEGYTYTSSQVGFEVGCRF